METTFNNLFDNINNLLEPSPASADDWSGRDKLSQLVIPGIINATKELIDLKQGQKAKCLVSNGRKIIFLGSDAGTVMVYQHFPDKSEKLRVCACDKFWEQLFCIYFTIKPTLKHNLNGEELSNILEYTRAL